MTHTMIRTADSDKALLARYRDDGDVASRDAFIERYLPLARHLSRRYRSLGDLTPRDLRSRSTCENPSARTISRSASFQRVCAARRRAARLPSLASAMPGM